MTPGPDVSVWWGSLEGVDPRGGTKGPPSPDEHPPPSPPVRQGDSASLPSLFHLATSKISFSSDQLAPSLLRGFHDAGYTAICHGPSADQCVPSRVGITFTGCISYLFA